MPTRLGDLCGEDSLAAACGALWWSTYFSLAARGIRMDNLEKQNTQKEKDKKNKGVEDSLQGASLVGNEYPDPFKRRDSITRTPPKGRSSSWSGLWLGDGGIAQEGREEVKQSAKRPREETPSLVSDAEGEIAGSSQMKELKATIENLKKGCKELKEELKGAPYTKNEIKKGIKIISQIAEMMQTRWIELERCLSGGFGKESGTSQKEAYVQTEPIDTQGNSANTSEIGLQADLAEIENTVDNGRTSQIEAQTQTDSVCEDKNRKSVATQVNMETGEEKILAAVENGVSFDDIAGVLDSEWPEDIYKTDVLVANPTKLRGDWDVALVIDPKNPGVEGMAKKMKEKYSEITSLMDGVLEEGQVEFLQEVIKTSTSRGNDGEKVKYTYLLPFVVDEKGVNDMKCFHEMLERWKQLVDTHGGKSVAVATPEGLDRKLVRKIIEHTFRRSNTKMTYLMPRGTNLIKQTEENPMQHKRQKSHKSPDKTIVIKAKDRT